MKPALFSMSFLVKHPSSNAMFIRCLVMACCFFSSTLNAQTLLAGWDFQTTTSGGTAILPAPNTQNVFQSNVGSGTLYLNGTLGSNAWTSSATSALNQLNAFTGSALNASSGLTTTTTTPACLALVNNSANGFNLIFSVDMTNYIDLVVSYATQRTTAGFTTQSWEYSSDAVNWIPWQSINTLPSSFSVMTLNTLQALNHAPTAYLRLNVTGATGSLGNNRLDNIQLTGTFSPASPYDPAISNLLAPTANLCNSSNETLEATICNYGTQSINLATDPITVTYTVLGNAGLVTYTQLLDSGIVGSLGTNCINSMVNNVDLSDGGVYLINAIVSCPTLTNGNLLNDSMPVPSTITSIRPTVTHYSLCTGGSIPTGQGLTASSCNPFSNQWYDAPSGGSSLYSGTTFNPLLYPNAVVNNSQTSGEYTFYVACSISPSCRTAAKLIIDPSLGTVPVVTSTPSCAGLNLGAASVSVPLFLNVLTPSPAQYPITTAVFGPSISSIALSGEVKYHSNPDTACVAYPPGTFAGKIALIDRGSCFFELKTYNAEQAGATAVIIVNNVPGPPITMGAANLYAVNIPVVMVSDVDGQAIKNMLSQPAVVNVNTPSPYTNILWSTTETTLNIANLVTGFYTVTVTDTNGCMASGQTLVVSREAPVLSFVNKTPCTGLSTGSSTATMTNYQQQLTVTMPNGNGQIFPFAPANFGPSVQAYAVNGNIRYYSNPDDGCNPYPTGALTNWVALIDRGGCFFEQKVYNAQQAGAYAVIIVNNVPDPIFNPGVVNQFTINIPSIMISQADGQVIKNWLQSNTLFASTPNYMYIWIDANVPYPQPILSFSNTLANVGQGDYQLYVSDLNMPNILCQTTGNVSLVEAPPLPAPSLGTVYSNAVACGGESIVLEISNSSRNCIALNGVDQWIDLGVNTTNLNDADFTIEAWVRTSGNGMGIVTSSDNDSIWEPGERIFYIDYQGNPSFVGYGNNYILSSQSVNDNLWHHVAVTWSYLDSVGRIFIDGVDKTIGSPYLYVVNTSPNIGTFSIGRPNFLEAPNFFQGEIDEVKIWYIARDLQQIRATMNYPMDNEPGLISYYRFDDAFGILVGDRASGFHGTPMNQAGGSWSNAFNNIYNLHYGGISASGIYPRWGIGNTPAVYSASITSSLGCTSAIGSPLTISEQPEIIASGPTTFCDSGSVTLSLDQSSVNSRQYATHILNYSTQYSLNLWGSLQALNEPDTYPLYGDLSGTWASALPDGQREYLEFGFRYPMSINYVDLYETYNPGAVDTVYVKDGSGNWQVVYSAPASIQPTVSRIMHIKFPDPGYPVTEIRVAMNSPAVPGWNEIDAVAIGYEPGVVWSNGDTTLSTTVQSTGNYTAYMTEHGGCVDTSNTIQVVVDSCSVALNLKLFFEGYYSSSGQMNSVLFNQGVSNDLSLCDTIDVELRQSNFPYAVVETAQALLRTDGTANVSFQTANPGNYYISVRHRNTINTWSAIPVQISPVPMVYDFSYTATQAYGDNMREIEPGVWAFYSGELMPDDNIDLLDASTQETAINNFYFGYYAEDINGDGNVDLLDVPVLENNLSNFIFSAHP